MWFMDGLQKLLRIKEYYVHVLGSTYEHLKREHRVYKDYTVVRVNRKYLDKMEEVLGLNCASPVSSPFVAPTDTEMEQKQFLEGENVTLYRTCDGIVLYIAMDRPDIQNRVRLFARSMQTPTDLNLQ